MILDCEKHTAQKSNHHERYLILRHILLNCFEFIGYIIKFAKRSRFYCDCGAGKVGEAAGLELFDPYFLPMSALLGDNVVERGDNLTWFDGPPLMEYLDNDPDDEEDDAAGVASRRPLPMSVVTPAPRRESLFSKNFPAVGTGRRRNT